MDASGSSGRGQTDAAECGMDRTGDDDGQCPGQPNGTADHVDKYTQSIELYNACRRFYVTRVQVADDIKAKLKRDLTTSGSRDLDVSMGRLREEVVSLIDQDLTLMHQLLTLNERIEELKWHRKLSGYLPASMLASASSGNIVGSDCSAPSDWNVDRPPHDDRLLHLPRESGSEADLLHSKYLSPSKLSLFRECVYSSAQDDLHQFRSSDADLPSRDRHVTKTCTSDLGSSDELVNSTSDVRQADNPYRLSKGDSCISSGCPSNSSSLKKSDIDDDVMTETTDLRLGVSDSNSDAGIIHQKYSRDTTSQRHELEMTI